MCADGIHIVGLNTHATKSSAFSRLDEETNFFGSRQMSIDSKDIVIVFATATVDNHNF